MAYTGTGTQADPYIVSSWEDFKAVCTETNAYIAFDPDAENKVIDINDTEDRGGLKKNLLCFSYVEGNGWEIRNFVAKDYYIVLNQDNVNRLWHNLHFRNVIGLVDRVFYGAFNFENCTFTGMMLNKATLLRSALSSGSPVNRCSFHLQLWGSSTYPALAYLKMTNSHIHLEGKAPVSIIYANNQTYLENCKLTGQLHLDGGTFSLAGSLLDRNTVTAMEITGTGTVNLTTVAAAVCIVDTELLSDTLTINLTGTNRLGLTTAQMQDPVYLLKTVGFPCMEVTA